MRGICPCTFRGRQIRETLIFSLERIFDKCNVVFFVLFFYQTLIGRVQRKSFLQLAIRASWSKHLLAQTSFQLAPKAFRRAELISHFFCYSNSSKNITCPSDKLTTDFTSPIAKSTSTRAIGHYFLCTLIGQHFCYFSCLSSELQCCDLVATGLRPWVNFALRKLTGHLFVTWKKRKKGKESVLVRRE